MSWITAVWSVNAGICLTLAGVQLLVWAKSRDSWANLLFAIAAAAGVANVIAELALMRAQTPEQFGELLRALHVPLGVMVVSLVWFVRLYLRAGRLWLAWLVTGLRLVVLMLTFSLDPNLNFRQITGLEPVSLWGETVVVAIGEKNPWTNITHLSGILFLVFVLDAAWSAWRRGEHQRAGTVGVTFGVAIVVALILSELLNRGTLPVPFALSFPFLIILVGIAYELSIDLVRARQIAQELHISQERMRLATSGAEVGIWEWDVARDEMWVSDTVRARYGLAASERVGLGRLLQTLHSEDRERTEQTLRQAIAGGEEFDVEYRARTATGATRWVNARGRAILDEKGKARTVRGVSLDITERKIAEEKLRQLGEFNQQVLASLHHEIAILDRSGSILAVNDAWKAFAQAYGNGADGEGVNYLDVCRDAASAGDLTASPVLEGIRSVLDGTREFFEMEYSCGLPDENRMFLMRVVPLRAAGGGAVVSHVEITRLKQAELEMRDLRRDLAHMSRVSTMGQFSSALAHELNQPLGAILRNAEAGALFMQRNPPDCEEAKAIFRDIKRDDLRAAAIIERMRGLLQCREPEYGRVSVRELVDQVIMLARIEFQRHRVPPHVEIPDGLPQVRGDRVQVQQVVLNLLVNALESLESVPVEGRRLFLAVRRTDRQFVEVAVSDTGPGIAAERLSQLFEPFRTSKSEGLGMGLSISRTIIQSHGGRIWAENNPGGGATFRFTLKVAEPEAVA